MAATRAHVIVSDRELNDTTDAWRCLRADTGEELWTYRYPAPGNLDYGNSPRATPVMAGSRVFLLGAFGHVACVDLATGKAIWEVNTADEFEPAESPKWGTCSTPLLVDDRLIVNPGAKDASLAALNARTGKTVWTTPGRAAGYGSFILATFSGIKQIIGHDTDSLGGWNPTTGERLWRLIPERPGDFNVPTPIPIGERLLVATENNGTRLYGFDTAGKIVPKPVAISRRLAPDTHTPVVAAGRVFGAWRRLYCLDLADGLKPVWDTDDAAFTGYCSLVTDGERVLALSDRGEFILFHSTEKEFKPLGRTKALNGEKGLYAHPAFVGSRAYIRGANSIACLDLSGP